MSWEEEYRAKHEEEEELAIGHVGYLQARLDDLQKELKHEHRKNLIIRWVTGIAVIVFLVWYYSGH